jgi:hypothetical protein
MDVAPVPAQRLLLNPEALLIQKQTQGSRGFHRLQDPCHSRGYRGSALENPDGFVAAQAGYHDCVTVPRRHPVAPVRQHGHARSATP